ncbi:MAG: gamma carbonic anhydrase family protein [Ramlibacter sp.]|nr:gamma carbonic anhydrase family protein [Ramlibacter sp.]
MNIHSNGSSPVIDPTTRVAATAVVSGDVRIGPNCSIGYGAVLVAEGGPIRIGAHCVVMETAVLRGVPGQTLRLGNHVLVGPRAYLVGCDVDDDVFLATGATVFNGAVLGRGCEVRINGLVHLRTVLEPGTTVPIGWVAVGSPARILPAGDHEGIWEVQKSLDFPRYVFGVERPAPGQSMMPGVMPRYAGALRRMHADDRIDDHAD